MYIGIYVTAISFPNAFLRHESVCTDSFHYHDENDRKHNLCKRIYTNTHEPLSGACTYVFASSIQNNDCDKHCDELRRQS